MDQVRPGRGEQPGQVRVQFRDAVLGPERGQPGPVGIGRAGQLSTGQAAQCGGMHPGDVPGPGDRDADRRRAAWLPSVHWLPPLVRNALG